MARLDLVGGAIARRLPIRSAIAVGGAGLLSLLFVGCMEESNDLLTGSDANEVPNVPVAGPVAPPPDSADARADEGAGTTPGVQNDGSADAQTGGDAAGTRAGTGDAAAGPDGQAPDGEAGAVNPVGEAELPPEASNSAAPAGSGEAVAGAAGQPESGPAPGEAAKSERAAASGSGNPEAGAPSNEPPPGVPASADSGSSSFLDRLLGSSSGKNSGNAPAAKPGEGGGTNAQGLKTGPPSVATSIPRVQKNHSDTPKYSQEELSKAGNSAKLEGTISCGICKGKVLLNVVANGELLTSASNLSPGPFSLLVPKGSGAATLTAIADDNSDGLPTAGEPLGACDRNPLSISDSDLDGIKIQIGSGS